MNCIRTVFTLLAFALTAFSQSAELTISMPKPVPLVGPILRPFHLERRVFSPANLTNTPRLESLVRGGNLYLSVRDVIALTLENNLDIAIQRFGPFMAQEVLRRAKGGGVLRSDINTDIIAGPQSVSTTGVSSNGSGLATGAGVGATAQFTVGYGPTPPSLDPSIVANVQVGHYTTPETNLVALGTTAFTQDQLSLYFSYSQQFITGTAIQSYYSSTRTNLNSPDYSLNPSTVGTIDINVTQPLLQGFGRAVNNRNIRVAKNNIKVMDLTVKLQVITTISAVLNLYWDLVSFNEDLRIKKQGLALAQQLFEDNQEQVKLGTLPPIEVTRAAAEVSARKEDLLISETNLAQQETVLKNALSRNGVESVWLDQVHIIALDSFEIPKTDELKPTAELIDEALANRPELSQTKLNLESSRMNVSGTKNSLLPTLSAFADTNNQGLTGPINPIYNNCCGPASPYFVGGYGNMLAQEFRRNFPNYSAGFSLSIPLRNRQAQADYAMDQLTLRRSELQLQRLANQIRVDVRNALIGLQQARSRFETAVATRQLAEQSLKAEQDKFKYGATGTDVTTVIQAQKDLVNDQTLEAQAMANYTHARISFDQAVGRTLDVNHVSMEEAASGRVTRESILPASLPPSLPPSPPGDKK
ncbi:MAG: TolC family protein [Bryobacteraceae bacterium]|jgi:outer membrane protein TolC